MVVDVYGISTLDPGAVPGWSTTDTWCCYRLWCKDAVEVS